MALPASPTFTWAPKTHRENLRLRARCCHSHHPQTGLSSLGGSRLGGHRPYCLEGGPGVGPVWGWGGLEFIVSWGSWSLGCHSEASSPCIHPNMANPEPTCWGGTRDVAKAPKGFEDFGYMRKKHPQEVEAHAGYCGNTAPLRASALPSRKGVDQAKASKGLYTLKSWAPSSPPQPICSPRSSDLSPKALSTALPFSSLLAGPGGGR